jgi:hypothetical protein
MKADILNKISRDFPASDQAMAVSEIESISLQHVMANSQPNLDKTLLAILQLSKGDLAKLKSFVSSAKQDFRDVIYWASLENEQSNT